MRALIFFLVLPAVAFAQKPKMTTSNTMTTPHAESAEVQQQAQVTYTDIQKTLGLVPSFMRAYPPEGIPGAWAVFKGIELNPNSAIPPKYKELIGIAVAAQIPCKYCTYFHTQNAKAHGATDEEVKEAIAEAAITRQWSTYLNGIAEDETTFRSELQRMTKQPPPGTGGSGTQPSVTDLNKIVTPDDARADIQRTFGFVPTFLQSYPQEGLVGAWKQMKGFEFNPNTALPAKYKSLIGLAVSAQVPCRYCVEFDTEDAKQANASQREINEAVAVASITRHWSTVLNGNDLDEATFRRETDQILKNAKSKAPATGGSGQPMTP